MVDLVIRLERMISEVTSAVISCSKKDDISEKTETTVDTIFPNDKILSETKVEEISSSICESNDVILVTFGCLNVSVRIIIIMKILWFRS